MPKTKEDLGTIPAQRKYFTKSQEVLDLPNLIEIQTKSYDWFIKEGIAEIFDEISPIEDFTGKLMELSFKDYYLEEEKYPEKVAKIKKMNYEAPLKVTIELKNKANNKVKTQEVFLGDLPVMTKRGTFIINGVERVIVSQLVRSAGVFFTAEAGVDRKLFGAKIIPGRGAWLELETSAQDVIYVKIDRKRKFPITTLLRAFGLETNEEILKVFADVNTNKEHDYIKATLEKDTASTRAEAYVETYKRIRPGDLATADNSKSLIDGMFFDFKKYDLSRVGRYKMNRRLEISASDSRENRVLRVDDLVAAIKEIIKLNNSQGQEDDIDHLGNRRLRTVGELIQQRFRIGLLRTERIIKDRMSTNDPATVTASQLVNVRPIVASVREFFATSQLSQFMDQTNPVAELANKRRLSALGPGGLTRERAGFEVRDVHRTHYGRICPIETPEGPNIGLVNSLASYARVNDFGFLETPYRVVVQKVKNDGKSAIGEIAEPAIKDEKGKVIVKTGTEITSKIAKDLAKVKKEFIKVKPRVTKEIVYIDAMEEENSIIAQANVDIDDRGYFTEKVIAVRRNSEADEAEIDEIGYVDVSSKQPVSVPSALIPFLEHDEARRALMGANMQRQAVSLIKPESPVVGTGIEVKTAEDSGQIIRARKNGEVISSTADAVRIKYDDGQEEIYILEKFEMSNAGTCINQKPVVCVGDKVKKGDLLIDGTAIDNGEIALGQNILAAYMHWGGGNYEDAIIISEKLVHDDRYTSIHLEEFVIDVRDTKLGPEIITRDIPNVGEEALRDLDESGIVRAGAEVVPGDILVGKITPKGETELTAEERLLRAIFGEKARDVKDSSLRLSPGEHGKVIDVRMKSRERGDELPAGVISQIFVTVAQMRKTSIGDKMAGRHGNKGVIAKILPVEDMPYLEDGTPIDIILNPLGVGARMNIGQVLETHLGWAAKTLGYKVASPVFDGVSASIIKEELRKAGLPEDGRAQLYDGRTGEPFDQRTTVGINYMLKLLHLVEDKIHARSVGPYAMVTQQPLGGKAQFGGQRFGEMEVWALEAYGAAHILQEMLTIKSDDVIGRSKAYESIIKGDEIKEPRVPESFNVLIKELQSLGLSVDLLQKDENDKVHVEVDAEEVMQEAYQEDIEELEGIQIIEGQGATELPTIDVNTESEEPPKQ